MTKRCWGAMVVVLNDVIEICKKHDIKMYAISEAVSGAVRHKGFIPWDDDLDICIWREDLKRFSDAMNRELSGSYKVLECNTQQYNYLEPWYRIVNSVNQRTDELLFITRVQRHYGKHIRIMGND